MSTSSISTTLTGQGMSPGLWNRVRRVGITGIVVAVVLNVAGWILVMSAGNNGSVPAAIGILFMTAPVALARRQPILAVSIVALAAIVNGLLWDDVIRCGAAFPALLYITFAVGARSRVGGRSWGWPLLGLAIAFVSVAAQGRWDPALDSGFLPFAVPVVLVCWGAGVGWAVIEPRIRQRSAGGDRRVNPEKAPNEVL